MKKIISIILSIAVIIGAISLSACSNQGKNENGKIKIVATVFPIYDWVKNIAGDKAEVSLLINSGADLHSFQPTADDIISISSSDLFIFVGGESDEWAQDIIKSSASETKAINLIESLGNSAKEEELVEGMQGEEEEEGEGEEKAEYDEHIWLSLKNAEILSEKITAALCEIDEANADFYKANSKEYIKKISALEKEYALCAENAKNRVLLFGDRFPFRYLTEDYSIEYFAAFIGCSAETEASFETITFLAKKVDELKLKYVIALEGTEHKIAQTIIDNTKDKNAKILTMNSMQSITAKDVEDGASYLGIMQENLAVLQEALN